MPDESSTGTNTLLSPIPISWMRRLWAVPLPADLRFTTRRTSCNGVDVSLSWSSRFLTWSWMWKSSIFLT